MPISLMSFSLPGCQLTTNEGVIYSGVDNCVRQADSRKASEAE